MTRHPKLTTGRQEKRRHAPIILTHQKELYLSNIRTHDYLYVFHYNDQIGCSIRKRANHRPNKGEKKKDETRSVDYKNVTKRQFKYITNLKSKRISLEKGDQKFN